MYSTESTSNQAGLQGRKADEKKQEYMGLDDVMSDAQQQLIRGSNNQPVAFSD